LDTFALELLALLFPLKDMDLIAGYPFWLLQDGLPFCYPKLLKNLSTRVAILGGGISGALAAYFLTEAGIECVLVDGRSIGLGSTCASTSLLQYELDIPLHQLKEKVGEYPAVRAYQLCGESIDILKDIMDNIGYSEYEMRQSLFYTRHASEISFLKKECTARKNAGFEVSVLSGEEIKKEYGLNAKAAILSQKGATINAYTLTHALLQHSLRKGLQVFDRSKITSVNYGGQVELRTAEGWQICCEKMVNASGFEIIDFISKGIVDLYCTYAVVSENAAEKDALWKDRIMIWNTDDPYLYLRLTKDNRVLIGGRDERFSTKASRSLYEKKSELLEKDLKKIFPELIFKREFAWSGTFGKTKDALPYIGAYAKTPNAYYALGFGGNGITFSVIAAQILTDLIQGRVNREADIFSFNRKVN
jgi:glycine/D-amino acid oxidase-like deaminating enzyme